MRKRGRSCASRARATFKPRWGLWACLGVFILSGALNCDKNAAGPGQEESGFVYVAGYRFTGPGVQKYLAKTGERKEGFTPKDMSISADIDPDTGDVFAYTWNYLRRYTSQGRLKYEVRANTQWYSGREYVALNENTGIIYFLNGEGRIYRFRAGDGEEVGFLRATGMEDAEQLLVDDVENTLWIVGKAGVEVGKYNYEGDELFKLSEGPYTRACVDGDSSTVILGVTKNGGNYLYRYSKSGVKQKDITTGIEPKGLGVEPGSGVLWVSDGKAIERYAASGQKLDGLPQAGFFIIDFAPDGAAAFAVDAEGYLSAYKTVNLNEAWREQRFHPRYNDVHFLKYNDK